MRGQFNKSVNRRSRRLSIARSVLALLLLTPSFYLPFAQPDAVANPQVRDTVLLRRSVVAIVHSHRKLITSADRTLLPFPAANRAGVRSSFFRAATERDVHYEPDR